MSVLSQPVSGTAEIECERPSSEMSHKSSGGVGLLCDCLAAVVLTKCTFAGG